MSDNITKTIAVKHRVRPKSRDTLIRIPNSISGHVGDRVKISWDGYRIIITPEVENDE